MRSSSGRSAGQALSQRKRGAAPVLARGHVPCHEEYAFPLELPPSYIAGGGSSTSCPTNRLVNWLPGHSATRPAVSTAAVAVSPRQSGRRAPRGVEVERLQAGAHRRVPRLSPPPPPHPLRRLAPAGACASPWWAGPEVVVHFIGQPEQEGELTLHGSLLSPSRKGPRGTRRRSARRPRRGGFRSG